MSEELEFLVRAVLIGTGATAVIDLWSVFLARALGMVQMNWSFVGRWIGHFPRGRFIHANMAEVAPVHGERFIGWLAHYLIGVIFAMLLLAICGLDWAREPTLLPALVFGVFTVVAPFFVMQPGMGAGVAASKMPNPNIARIRSLVTHAVFGAGLYVAALFLARFVTLSQ